MFASKGVGLKLFVFAIVCVAFKGSLWAQTAVELPEAQRIQLRLPAGASMERVRNRIHGFDGLWTIGGGARGGVNTTAGVYGATTATLQGLMTYYPHMMANRNEFIRGLYILGLQANLNVGGSSAGLTAGGTVNGHIFVGGSPLGPRDLCHVFGGESADLRLNLHVNANGGTSASGRLGTEVGALCISHDGRHRFMISEIVAVEGNSGYLQRLGDLGADGSRFSGRSGVSVGALFRYSAAQNRVYVEASYLRSIANFLCLWEPTSTQPLGASGQTANLRGSVALGSSNRWFLVFDVTYLRNDAGPVEPGVWGNTNYQDIVGSLMLTGSIWNHSGRETQVGEYDSGLRHTSNVPEE